MPPPGNNFSVLVIQNKNIIENTILDIILIPANKVEFKGRVLDGIGNGIPNQKVSFSIPGNNTIVASSTTDGNGAYSMQVAPGKWAGTH